MDEDLFDYLIPSTLGEMARWVSLVPKDPGSIASDDTEPVSSFDTFICMVLKTN